MKSIKSLMETVSKESVKAYCYSCGENDSNLVKGCIKSGCEHERVGEAFTEVF